MSEEKDKKKQDGADEEEFILDEPDTGSVGKSPVTGQTADDSQDAPGQ